MAKQFKAWDRGSRSAAQRTQEDTTDVADVATVQAEADPHSGPTPVPVLTTNQQEPKRVAAGAAPSPITQPRAKAFAVAPGRTISTNRGTLTAGALLVSSDFDFFDATIARLLAKRAVVET